MPNQTASTIIADLLSSSDKEAARNILQTKSITEISDLNSQITSIVGTSTPLSIYSLTAIPENWQAADADLNGLSIGSSVTSIGNSAFYLCSNLRGRLFIPNSVTTIGSYAFYDCFEFTGGLTIPNSVTSIGNAAFLGCYKLTELNLGNSVATIGSFAFYNCFGLTKLKIPSSTTTIGSFAFYSCSLLESVHVECNASGVNSIAFDASVVNVIYYKAGTTGWTNPWNGVPTAVWTSWPDFMA